MYKKINFKVIFLASLLSLFVTYCGEPIPVDEMGNAKYEISRAESVKADVYAKEKYEQARATLFESHDLVTKNKLKEAKEKAIEAQGFALEAYNQAIPELAKETRNEAEEMIKEADRAYAEELAAEAFNNSKTLMATGDEKMTAQSFYEAFQAFENSREEAIKARNQSEAQAENLERELIAVEDLIKEAIEYGANETTPDKISEADSAAKRAHEYLANKYLKDAHTEIAKAQANALEAAEIAKKDFATKKKLEASGAVEDAEKEMVNLKAELEKSDLKQKLSKSDEAQESLKNAEETLTASQESLNNAGQTLDQQKYPESVDHSKEAIRLAKLVKDQIPALLVLVKQGQKQPDLREQATVEATTKGETPKAQLAEGWKSYTVRLIPERRDCLWRIAEYKYIYGDPFKWTRIYKANKSQIKNPDLIYPGQIFDIPPATGELTKPVSSPIIEKKAVETEKSGEVKETVIDRPRMNGATNNSTDSKENEQNKNQNNSEPNTTPADNIN